MNRSIKFVVFLIVIATLCLPAAALYALSLEEAKVQGLVGERLDGYLGVIVAGPEVERIVQEINVKRKSAYQEIARKNGASLQTVETLAAQKAINNTPAGQFVQRADKGWARK